MSTNLDEKAELERARDWQRERESDSYLGLIIRKIIHELRRETRR